MRILKPANKATISHRADDAKASDKSPDSIIESGDFLHDLFNLKPTAKTADKSIGHVRKTPEDSNKKEFNRLWASAIRLLAMREHSRKELEKKLSAKSDRLDIVHAVLDELIEEKYQSDSRYTESFVRSWTVRGRGPIKIKNELKSKGVKINMIEEFLDANSGVWFDTAKEQYEKKYGDDPVTDYNTWTKRARFMQSRGFSMEHIHVTLPSVQYD